MDTAADILQRMLIWAVLPLWTLAGLADARTHRALRIEHSAGWTESALHLAMLTELGFAVLLAAVCETNAAVLLCLFLLCIAHDLTMAVDLVWAERRRGIPPIEQWIHGIQQTMPWFALAALTVAHVAQSGGIAAALSVGGAWTFHLRDTPLPAPAWAAIGIAGAALTAAFLREAVRAWHARACDR